MTVYIEFVIIDNFVIDYLLLKATFVTTGTPTSRWRLFLCSFLGSIVALLFPLLKTHVTITAMLKLCSGLLIVLLSANYKSFKGFLFNSAVFFCYTFISGGAIIGVFNLLAIDYSTEICIALIIIPTYFLLRSIVGVVKFVYRRKDIVSLTYSIKIGVFNKEFSAIGFMDTGNGLYDADSPVVVCNKKFFLSLLGEQVLKTKIKKIAVRTVVGQTCYPAIKLDYLKIYIRDEPNIFNNVTLCVAKSSVGEGYDLILHPALLRENKENVFNIKEVS